MHIPPALVNRQGPIFLVSVVAFGAATAFFGLARSFWLAMLALILVGAADTVSTIIRNTIRQLQTPDYIRGRMTGVNQIFFMGGPQLGEVESGVVAQLFGAPAAIISGGVGASWRSPGSPGVGRNFGGSTVMSHFWLGQRLIEMYGALRKYAIHWN